MNKLTGGALSGIVGSLASGLIKGVLGINAGVVNLKAATVVGGGMGGAGAGAGGAVAGGGAKSIVGRLGRGLAVFGTVAIAGASIVALAQACGDFTKTVTDSQADLQGKVDATAKQNFAETIANLRATNRTSRD